MAQQLVARLQQSRLAKIGVAASAAVMGSVSHAAGTDTTFSAFETLMTDWAGGSLGRGLAIGAFLLGAVGGLVRSTIMPALIGLAFALLFLIGPGVITNIMSATI